MAPLSRQEIEDIIARDAPGYEIVSTDNASRARTRADQPGADIAELRGRFPGETAATGSRPGDRPRVNEHDQLVAVRPKQTGDQHDYKAGPKTVLISGSEKRIIGYQG